MRELDYGKIGMRIRQVRRAKGWSQGELAERCGISMSFLGHIERGSRIMSMETFANICAALESGADELLWGLAGSDSKAVLDMWNLPDKRKQKGKAENADRQAECGMQEKEAGKKNADSYAMYVKIMKSVAEIMNGE